MRLRSLWTIAGSALGAGVLTLLLFAPRFWTWTGLQVPDRFLQEQPEIHRAQFLLSQVDHPWQRIPGIERTSDLVIEWRLLFPVAAHYLHLPPQVFLTLPFIGCLATLMLVASLLWRHLGRPMLVFGGTLLAANCSWFFVSTGWLGYQDSWLAFALVLACFAVSRRTLVLLALLAPWVDERFIIALPLVLGVRLLGGDSPRGWRSVVPAAIALTVGVAPYLLIRLGVECFGLRETSRSYWSHSGLLAASAGQLVAGAWQGLRAGWPAVAAFLILGSSRVDLPTRLAACAGVVTAFAANLLVAQDLSRSASVLLPVLVAGVLLGVKAWPKAAPVAVTLLCIADLLLPARHILNIYEVPIERFPAELARWRQRPNLRDSAYLTGQGYTAMRRQDPENALQWFDAALSADSANGEARVNRGVLLCTVDGKPDEGLAELSRALTVNPGLLDAMVARNPELLELRFVRAYVEMQGGNPEAAAVDLREILPRAPLSSPLRQKTQELLQQVENRSR